MLISSGVEALLVAGMVFIGSSAYAGERVDGPLVAAGLWEISSRSIVLEWQEYPNAVKVIRMDAREVKCEGGVREGGDWIRAPAGALLLVGAGTSESGMGTSSLVAYSGDYSRQYIVDRRYETFGLGLIALPSNMDGRAAAVHSRDYATRIGDCPKDMKPGENRKIEASP